MSPCPAPSKPSIPVCSAACFRSNAAQFEDLRAAMGKLRLNDASFSFEMETQRARLRFRCGFLGPVASEIIQDGWSASSISTDRDRAVVIYKNEPARRAHRSSCKSGRHAGRDEVLTIRGAMDRGDDF